MTAPGYILVVGDVMLDRRIEGRVSRVSPEAPVPVVLQQQVVETPGGVANVAANISALGGCTKLVGLVGDDATGRALRVLLSDRHGVATCLVNGREGYRTTTKTRITSQGQQLLRVDDETVDTSREGINRRLLAGIQSALSNESQPLSAIVAVDYDKGTIDEEIIAALLAASAKSMIPLVVDAKPAKLPMYAGAALCLPNILEATEVANRDGVLHPALLAGTVDDKADCLAKHLRDKYRFQNVVITCGGHGAVYLDVEGESCTVAVEAKRVYDVTGAGDVFTAVMVTSLASGYDFHAAVVRANVAGGLAVSLRGTSVITAGQLEDAMLTRQGWLSKLTSEAEAMSLVARRRREGKSVSLVFGSFDPFNAADMWLLRAAKSSGDVLLVAYKSDEAILSRPELGGLQVGESYRGTHLAMFEPVDCVFSYNGDGEALVRRVQPDVLGQYTGLVEGVDYVAKRGGRVVFSHKFSVQNSEKELDISLTAEE